MRSRRMGAVLAFVVATLLGCDEEEGPRPTCGNGVCEPGETSACADCATGPVCGDGVCQPGETTACADCAAGPICGDGACDPGETAAGCPDDCGAPDPAALEVRNDSSFSIWYLYVAACGASSWGSDQLGASTIPAGAVFTVNGIPPGCYRLRATTRTSDYFWETQSDVTLVSSQTYVWTLTGKAPYGRCSSDADCAAATPTCVRFDTGWMCSASCGSTSDCPAPDAAGTEALCALPWSIYFCLVDCTAGGACPTGTTCAPQSNGKSVCL